MYDDRALTIEPFQPPWSLRSPGLQSLLATKGPTRRIWRSRGLVLDPLSRDHILDCGNGVRLTGCHTPAPTARARGLVVLIHGWEGGHYSNYLYSLACALHRAGYATFRLNLRDHADSHALNEDMFHSARIAEVLDAIHAVQRFEPARPLSVVGFSLGGNFALRVGLHGPAAGLEPRLCMGISPVVVPGNTLIALDQGPAVYHRYFRRKWQQTMGKKATAWPGRYDFSQLRQLKSFTAITRAFVEAHTEFATLEDYISAYTLTPELLMASPTPLAIITAHDDSVIPIADFEGLREAGSMVSFQATAHGGHCGFIENWKLDSWAEAQVLRLLTLHADARQA